VSWHDAVLAPGITRASASAESEVFGLSIDRITVSAASAATFDEVLDAAAGSAADVVVLRYPAERTRWFAGLSALPGRTALPADVLQYWRLRTGSGRRTAEPPEFDRQADPEAVDALVTECFGGYPNHYDANPLFDGNAASTAYRIWIRRSIAAGDGAVLHEGGVPISVVTWETRPGYMELLLGGIAHAARGRGLYETLLSMPEDLAARAGIPDIVTSTQAHNTGSSRMWARYGFVPVHAVATVHLVRAGLLPPAAPALALGGPAA
jgi:hypothetical protein